jgi:hypothetical protein
MQTNKALAGVIVILFLLIDFLKFHDLFETHMTTDWLTLLASVLVFVYIWLTVKKKK